MTQCLNCKYAVWKRTAAGTLHPSGDGRCTWEYPTVALPKSMFWISGPSRPSGSYLSRKKDNFKDCVRFEEKPQ